MVSLFFGYVMIGLLTFLSAPAKKHEYISKEAGFRVSFPVMFKDSSWTKENKKHYRIWAHDGHSEYVVQCEEVDLEINFKDWSWKTFYDSRLKSFCTTFNAEKTEDSRYDLGETKGLDAILNLRDSKETIVYRNVIIQKHSYTIYIRQPRQVLNEKKIKTFRKSFRIIKIRQNV